MAKKYDMLRTRMDDVIDITTDWNNRKLSDREAMFKIFNIVKKSVIPSSKLQVSNKKCGWCKTALPKNRISYCDKHCMKNHKEEIKRLTKLEKKFISKR